MEANLIRCLEIGTSLGCGGVRNCEVIAATMVIGLCSFEMSF